MFTEPEIKYLKSERLARIATVSRNKQPNVVPVAFEFDGKRFYVGSRNQEVFFNTRKYKDVKKGNKKVSLVIDDIESVDPWRPRQIKVQGTAEVVDHNGMFGPGKYLEIVPAVSWSWGVQETKAKEGPYRARTVHQ